MDGCPANMTWARIDDKYDTTNFSYCKFPITKKIGGTMTGRYGAVRKKSQKYQSAISPWWLYWQFFAI
jgi:uncharacterized protein affecting Mg2+/Co2+ transport